MPLFKTFCPRCKQTRPGIVREIPPALAFQRTCSYDGTVWVGETACPHCGREVTDRLHVEPIPRDWHVPALSNCRACDIELAEWAEAVAQGAVYFRCRRCWAEGLVPANSTLATYVRDHVRPPAAPRCELGECPRCNEPRPQ